MCTLLSTMNLHLQKKMTSEVPGDQLDQPDDNKIKSEVNCSNYCYALTTPARSKTSFSLMLVGGVDSDLASVKKTKQPGAAILQSSIT